MSFTSPSNGTFVISNAKSGTALDLKQDGIIIGYKKHGGENQQWEVQQTGSGKWTFRNKRGGKYLAIEGGQAGDNKQIIGQDQPYEWFMNVDQHIASKGFRIYADPCFNLDLDNGSDQDGTRVSVWGQWTEQQGTAPHQSWQFTQA
ncbi:carbohydrate-binding module family 13 protein [Cylindrobasidium torrendii FP15055 ss-10]|uniref:Carbohydrate-binding module family 13 protein n=1 Tax=Cylindrobasidium torrendii FP15055 ss-10 TaxID=1314674 RepID=A0A0D7BAR2_9AGAR|nr:carbohydrate-binding module family 13 protein [Cylindrobasidium torrendii FP15055 ss-10]